MKRIITVALICIMMTLLMACSGKEKETVKEITPTEAAEPTAEPTAAPTATPTPEPEPEEDYTGKKLIALTFDDGPNLQITPLVLDILEEQGVVASFFLIGQNINDDTKAVMERQLELGCEIANHSWSHKNMSTMTDEELKKEIQDTSDKIFEMVGVTPAFFRPPFIATSVQMYESIDLPFINGINCVDWDASVTAEKRSETIIANAQDGDIVLLHDFNGNMNTVEALDDMIQGLRDNGFAFVTISKLFELKGVDPNVESKLWTNPAW